MEIQKYVDQKKSIQITILRFLQDETDIEENLQNIFDFFRNQNVNQNPHEIKTILHLLAKIACNTNRLTNFYGKIEKILNFFTNEIKNNFTNLQLFNIFKKSKRLLLYFITNKLITIDEQIFSFLSGNKYRNQKYLSYFYPEIKSFLSKEESEQIENELRTVDAINVANFESFREIGENEQYICNLIRNDSIEKFITYVKRNNLLLSTSILTSTFETNSFLLKKNKCSLIQYSAFFGSFNIFKYLHLNRCPLKPSLWLYAIHGNNSELISYLEENNIEMNSKIILLIIKESIKCHHIELLSYIQKNVIQNSKDYDQFIYIQSFKNFNYSFFPGKIANNLYFYYFCKYDHGTIVKILLENEQIDINYEVIQKKTFFLKNKIPIFLIF